MFQIEITSLEPHLLPLQGTQYKDIRQEYLLQLVQLRTLFVSTIDPNNLFLRLFPAAQALRPTHNITVLVQNSVQRSQIVSTTSPYALR